MKRGPEPRVIRDPSRPRRPWPLTPCGHRRSRDQGRLAVSLSVTGRGGWGGGASGGSAPETPLSGHLLVETFLRPRVNIGKWRRSNKCHPHDAEAPYLADGLLRSPCLPVFVAAWAIVGKQKWSRNYRVLHALRPKECRAGATSPSCSVLNIPS